MGDVVAGFGVLDDEVLAVFHHDREIIESDVGARAGVVETPVRYFLMMMSPSFLAMLSPYNQNRPAAILLDANCRRYAAPLTNALCDAANLLLLRRSTVCLVVLYAGQERPRRI